MNQHHREIKKGRKFDQVVDGAREVFMREGFEGASVDEIARVAQVSKATLYSYFPDKQMLFLEVARRECVRFSDAMSLTVSSASSTREALTQIARGLTGFFMSEFGKAVFRISVGESDRFPELGRTFFESGPLEGQKRMQAFLECAVADGKLEIEDCQLAAGQFAELCKAHCFPRVIFNVIEKPSKEDVERVVQGAVDMFLARYGVAEQPAS